MEKADPKTDPLFKKGYKKGYNICCILEIYSSTEDMGFEPTHAVTRLPRFQHGLLSLLSNLPILTQIVYHKGSYLAIKILEIRKMTEFERK